MSKTDDLIAELRVLVEKATQGYWGWDDDVPKKWSDADWEKVAPWLANQDLDCVLSGNIVAENPHDVGYIATCNPENMRALLSRITELEQAQRWISVDERLPDVRAGDNQEVILKVRRANGKEYVFAAEYLNRYERYSEDDDADDEVRIYITGWYRLMADEEYDNAWHAVLNDGDSVIGWKPLPPP